MDSKTPCSHCNYNGSHPDKVLHTVSYSPNSGKNGKKNVKGKKGKAGKVAAAKGKKNVTGKDPETNSTVLLDGVKASRHHELRHQIKRDPHLQYDWDPICDLVQLSRNSLIKWMLRLLAGEFKSVSKQLDSKSGTIRQLMLKGYQLIQDAVASNKPVRTQPKKKGVKSTKNKKGKGETNGSSDMNLDKKYEKKLVALFTDLNTPMVSEEIVEHMGASPELVNALIALQEKAISLIGVLDQYRDVNWTLIQDYYDYLFCCTHFERGVSDGEEDGDSAGDGVSQDMGGVWTPYRYYATEDGFLCDDQQYLINFEQNLTSLFRKHFPEYEHIQVPQLNHMSPMLYVYDVDHVPWAPGFRFYRTNIIKFYIPDELEINTVTRHLYRWTHCAHCLGKGFITNQNLKIKKKVQDYNQQWSEAYNQLMKEGDDMVNFRSKIKRRMKNQNQQEDLTYMMEELTI